MQMPMGKVLPKPSEN